MLSKLAGNPRQVRIGDSAIGTAEAPASRAQIQSTAWTPIQPAGAPPSRPPESGIIPRTNSLLLARTIPSLWEDATCGDDAGASYRYDHHQECPPKRGRTEPERGEPGQDLGQGRQRNHGDAGNTGEILVFPMPSCFRMRRRRERGHQAAQSGKSAEHRENGRAKPQDVESISAMAALPNMVGSVKHHSGRSSPRAPGGER